MEADRSRADDYYLAEGTGLATRYVAGCEEERGTNAVRAVGTLDGPAYERWVAGYDVATGEPRGRLRTDVRGLRFVEVVVNGPKTWSLAASLHAEIADAYDAAQERAAVEIIGWLASHATTRVGPRGRQVQVPVEQLEAAAVRHYTSRAGDPHRHLHLQVNARVFAHGRWRGLHSVGVVDSIEALNGIGHAAVMCDPEFRHTLARHGYTLDPDTVEVTELAPFVGAFSARAAQIGRNVDRYEAAWRTDHPGEEPGPRLRCGWDRRAWAQARPDKIVPTDGARLAARWRQELFELGFRPPPVPDRDEVGRWGTPIGRINRDKAVDLVLTRLGGRRSSWNAADIRGEIERSIAAVDIIAPGRVRRELAEDLTARAVERCVPMLNRQDVPGHVRALTSRRVLAVDDELVARLARRTEYRGASSLIGGRAARRAGLGYEQWRAVGALTGFANLLVIEGAAGAGKTTSLAQAQEVYETSRPRMVVVTPTMKAARVARDQTGAEAFSAAWLIHQNGYRWDADGSWTRVDAVPDPEAQLISGDLLLVDEAGMLDQDTALALLTIADEAGARVAFVGDRHQLPAVGRGGVLDHAARWARPEHRLGLDTVNRFTDPEYAELSLRMRTGERSGEVFDTLVRQGHVVLHATEVERLAALTTARGLIVADTREQVAALNAAIRDHRLTTTPTTALTKGLTTEVMTEAGERIGVGDRVATRRNDRELRVANRDTWTVTALGADGGLAVTGRNGDRALPPAYVREHVELAYATTIHGAQGETVDHAHLLLGESTGAAAAYVGMTRGRNSNTAHLVADGVEDARHQWIDAFNRDRADLGPRHAPTGRGRGHRPVRTHRPASPRGSDAGRGVASAPGSRDPSLSPFLLRAGPGPLARDRHLRCPLAPDGALDHQRPQPGHNQTRAAQPPQQRTRLVTRCPRPHGGGCFSPGTGDPRWQGDALMEPIHIPPEWDDEDLITFEQFCQLIRTPPRTVRDWRRRRVGPRWLRIDGCGRLVMKVAEARRFLRSAKPTTRRERRHG